MAVCDSLDEEPLGHHFGLERGVARRYGNMRMLTPNNEYLSMTIDRRDYFSAPRREVK